MSKRRTADQLVRLLREAARGLAKGLTVGGTVPDVRGWSSGIQTPVAADLASVYR
jgi:hypothetical protein